MAGKTIIVIGGVYSGTGKGVAAASIALLLKLRGHTVQIIKFDPYLNVNAGILAPSQHGECFLCDDGTETDLDLGHYERIAGVTMSKRNICTSGTLNKELIVKQERGDYLGQTVQIIPHLTDLIQDRMFDLSKEADVVVAEIGGTVGDMESDSFYEAIRQYKHKLNGDVMIAMVAPIIWVPTIQEFKSKPLQNSIRELNRKGLQADVVLARVDQELPKGYLEKVSGLTGVPHVFEAPDVPSIYKVALEFYNRHVDDLCVDLLHLKRSHCRIHKLRELVEKPQTKKITVGVVGKYLNASEAYMSLREAIQHAAMFGGIDAQIKWIKADDLENKSDSDMAEQFLDLDGIIVPGGFDKRGVEGKIKAIKYCRTHKLPFLGICLGLQCAVIEFARNVCGIEDADSQEFRKDCKNPIIHYVKGQENIEKKSGTMRLGSYECQMTPGRLATALYGEKLISERHRHRLEVNADYAGQLEKNGLMIAGVNPQSNLIEIMEIDLKDHPFFIGTQAHPEFKSKLAQPHPLFRGLVTAAVDKRQEKNG